MLHQAIIVAIGYFIIDWDIHPVPKWLFLIICSFVSILLVYHFIVRTVKPLRFLFGMKLKNR
jgi:hypothetical protein